jgi:hypothetical protein
VVGKDPHKRFCNKSCSAKWRMRQPSVQEAMKKGIAKSAASRTGISRPDAAIRMRTNNPMNDPEVRERARQKLIGRTFLSRGGNGKQTPEQEAVATALGLPMEHPIATASVKHLFPSLPPCYKVDVACPASLLAVEIDGSSHNTRKWKFLDARKTEVLNALGWRVLRFSNQQVREDLPSVLDAIKSSMTLR